MAQVQDGGDAVVDRAAATVTAARVVPLPVEVVFDVVARPGLHPLLDGSGTVRRGVFGPERLTAVGQRFGMFMRQWGVPYPVVNQVKEFAEGELIAWSHVAGHRWRYRFEPVDDGAATRVVEQFDGGVARLPGDLYARVGVLEGHAASLPRSLERLEGLARSHRDDG